MVSKDLRSATEDLAGLFTDFDPVAVVEGSLGFGLGLFSAEFAAQFVKGMVQPGSPVMELATEILTKAGLGTAFFGIGMRTSGLPFIILMLAGVGVGVSGILQVVEALAETAARVVGGGDVPGFATASERTTVHDQSFGAPEPTDSNAPAPGGSLA